MLEVHTKEFPDSWPSSPSQPEPVNLLLLLGGKVAPFAGLVIDAVGRVLPGMFGVGTGSPGPCMSCTNP